MCQGLQTTQLHPTQTLEGQEQSSIPTNESTIIIPGFQTPRKQDGMPKGPPSSHLSDLSGQEVQDMRGQVGHPPAAWPLPLVDASGWAPPCPASRSCSAAAPSPFPLSAKSLLPGSELLAAELSSGRLALVAPPPSLPCCSRPAVCTPSIRMPCHASTDIRKCRVLNEMTATRVLTGQGW